MKSDAGGAAPAPEQLPSASAVDAIAAGAQSAQVARCCFIAAALIALADYLAGALLRHAIPNATVGAALALGIGGIAAEFAAGGLDATAGRGSGFGDFLAGEGWCAFAVAVVFLAFYGATISPPTPYIEPVEQAYALLHGRTWVDAPSYMEHIVWHGRSYLLHPPLAALVALPAVAVW